MIRSSQPSLTTVKSLQEAPEREEEDPAARAVGGGPRPTEGAPTPRNADGPAPAGRGERGPADLSPGCSRVARAAEVSAENGHSLGRREEGGRLGPPKGRKSRGGNTGTHFTETRTQETGSLRTAHLRTEHAVNTTQTQLTAQIFFLITQDAEPQRDCNP